MLKFFCQKTDKKFRTKKIKKRWTLDGFLRKLQTTGSIERTPEAVDYGGLKMSCFYVW